MLKKFRETPTSIEYWDTEEKRIVVGDDLANDQDVTIVANSTKSFDSIDFNTMSVKEIKEFAESQGIDIPKSMTKKELVIERITGESND